MTRSMKPIKSPGVPLRSDVISPSSGFHSTLSEPPLPSATPHSSPLPLAPPMALRASVLYSNHWCACFNQALPPPPTRDEHLKSRDLCFTLLLILSSIFYEAFTQLGLIEDKSACGVSLNDSDYGDIYSRPVPLPNCQAKKVSEWKDISTFY